MERNRQAPITTGIAPFCPKCRTLAAGITCPRCGTNVQIRECCICGSKFRGYGNNPAPLMEDTDSNPNRCCDFCNATKVIPARLQSAFDRREAPK